MSMMASQITGISIFFLTVCWGADQRKYQSSALLAFVRGIHWWLVNSLHKVLVMWKMFPFDDVIMTARRIFHQIWITSKKALVKQAPNYLYSTNNSCELHISWSEKINFIMYYKIQCGPVEIVFFSQQQMSHCWPVKSRYGTFVISSRSNYGASVVNSRSNYGMSVISSWWNKSVVISWSDVCSNHDDVIKWKHFRCYWPFVLGIHWSPVNSPHKGQWPRALMFSFICVWINVWINNREVSDLRHYQAHYDVTVMLCATSHSTHKI